MDLSFTEVPEKLLADRWINGGLSSFLTITHRHDIPLAGMECQRCCILAGVSSEYLIIPLRLLEVRFLWLSDNYLGPWFLALLLIELIRSFISLVFISLIIELGILPTT